MKISAYMFIRNGIRAGYTFLEAVENVMPFVDEFFILDGQSDDGTLEALRGLAKLNGKLRVESSVPEYVGATKDAKGLLLGAAFEEARQNCDGDWLIQVQADTVFHPVTLLAVREFLLKEGPGWSYDAIEVFRRQYRWNWQEMYREDRLALIFRKAAGRVAGDALNVKIEGKISGRFVRLFERFPLADNAWVFFENLAGKQAGCREIWDTPENHGKGAEFPWYDKATGRSFSADLAAYAQKGELPPFWLKRESPFKADLPYNLAGLVGLKKYIPHPRFSEPGGLYAPSERELNELRALAGEPRVPLKESLEETLVSAGFGWLVALLRRLAGG